MSGSSMADSARLVLEPEAARRDQVITARLMLPGSLSGRGELALQWTDVLGRLVRQDRRAIELADEAVVTIQLDLRRAVAMKNTVTAELSLGGQTYSASAEFVAIPDVYPWRDYIVLMWQNRSTEHVAKLRELGINCGMTFGGRTALPDYLIDNDCRWYVEGTLNRVYAQYHRWFPDRAKNYYFKLVKQQYRINKNVKDAFIRQPCLNDPAVLEQVRQTMTRAARMHRAYRPVFYSLADEGGVAELAAAWDFCFSPHCLRQFRVWLRQQYGTLAALNRQWQTDFDSWDQVVPLTTDEMMQRAGDNFSPWADHREFMDITFARACRVGRDAVHAVDPGALVGLGGTQMPGCWGGYDYWRLSQAIDFIEPYNIGNNVEIARSFRPGLVVATTAFARGPWETHRVWYQLLHGDRGLFIWDDKPDEGFLKTDGTIGPRGQEFKDLFWELRNGIGALTINSTRLADPIAIHYSQASIRAHWMLENRPRGPKWIDRWSWHERRDSRFLRLRESFVKLIEDQGLQYNFVAYEQIERGKLLADGYRLLLLPQSIAISAEEAQAIRQFVRAGGTVIADARCALMDRHCRRLEAGQLDELFGIHRGPKGFAPSGQTITPVASVEWLELGKAPVKVAVAEPDLQIVPASGARALAVCKLGEQEVPAVIVRNVGNGRAIYLNLDLLPYYQQRLQEGKERDLHRLFGRLVASAGIRPRFAVTGDDGQPVVGIETHCFANGNVTVLGLHSNPLLRVHELGPPEFQSNERFAKPASVRLRLPGRMYVYDIRLGKDLGPQDQLAMTVQPYEPTLLAICPLPLPDFQLLAPPQVARGECLDIQVATATSSPAAVHVFHVDLYRPDGKWLEYYSGNLLADHGRGSWHWPVAVNDPPGQWRIAVRDVLTGRRHERRVAVE